MCAVTHDLITFYLTSSMHDQVPTNSFKLPGYNELLPKGIITKLFNTIFRNGREKWHWNFVSTMLLQIWLSPFQLLVVQWLRHVTFSMNVRGLSFVDYILLFYFFILYTFIFYFLLLLYLFIFYIILLIIILFLLEIYFYKQYENSVLIHLLFLTTKYMFTKCISLCHGSTS